MIPIELFLKDLCPYGKFSLCNSPDLFEYLETHEQNGKLFFIEKTTAACGPYVLWYPLSAWHEELKRQKELNELIEKQLPKHPDPKETKRLEAREILHAQIIAAQQSGSKEMEEILRLALEQLQ